MQPQTGEADVSPVAQLNTQPGIQPPASPLAEQRAQRKTGSDETGAGKRTAQQPAVPEVQPPAAQDVSNILRVVEAKKPKKACGSGQKQQSSLGSRKERTVPSTKSDSHKSKAGKRSNLVPDSLSILHAERMLSSTKRVRKTLPLGTRQPCNY